jgi:predicted nuclease of predicted toxin-antitoxin system
LSDAVARQRIPYTQKKLRLYADENVPTAVVEAIRSDPSWRRKVTIETAQEAGNANRDDDFHFQHCRKHGLVLVTLDDDFMDDRRFPFGDHQPGIITIVGRSHDDLTRNLWSILDFITGMRFPEDFAGDAKFRVSNAGALMRGRDAETREIKTMRLVHGTSAEDVANHFGFLQPPTGRQ